MQQIIKNIASIALSFTCTTSSIIDSPNSIYLSNKSIKDNTLIDNYISYFENYSPIYYNQDYYPSDEFYTFILNSNIHDKTHTELIKDPNYYFKKIEENTKEYVKQTDYENPLTISSNNEKYILFKSALLYVLNDLIINSTNNIDEDLCRISSLKILFANLTDKNKSIKVIGKYYKQENTILIDYDKILTLPNVKTKEDILNQLEITLRHEINHLRQEQCNCNRQEAIVHNISLSDKYTSFIIESSAESELYNLAFDQEAFKKNNSSYNYYEYRQIESFLLSLALLDKKSINDYYNYIFDSDLNGLLEYLNAYTKEDKIDILKDINAINYFYHINTFDSSYNDDEAKVETGFNYRLDIFSKSLNELLDRTKTDNLSLEENILMFRLLKSFVTNKDAFSLNNLENIDSSLISYDKPNNITSWYFDEVFINDFNNLCNKYLEFLSKYYNIRKEELTSPNTNQFLDSIINELCTYAKNNTIIKSDDNSSFPKYIYHKYPLLKPILYSINNPLDSLTFYEETTNPLTYKLIK